MVLKLRFVSTLALLLACACTSSTPEERRVRDTLIGIAEETGYRFEAVDGLVHVLSLDATQVTARASAREFTIRLSRKDAAQGALKLRLSNVPSDLRLSGPAGVLSADGASVAGQTASDLRLGREWTITLPATTGAEIEIKSDPLPTAPFEFLAFGDIQDAIPKFGDMVAAMQKESNAEFILILGDLANRTRPDEYDALEKHFLGLAMPLYFTPGNHDVFRKDEFQNRYGRANYSMTYRGARFTSIDSASAEIDPTAYAWLQSWLNAGASQGHVVFTHIPARDYLGVRSGQWNSSALARDFVSRVLDGKVDLLLFGHVHTYHSYDLGGIPTYISGGGGAIPMKLDGVERHYLRIAVDPAAQTFQTTRVEIE